MILDIVRTANVAERLQQSTHYVRRARVQRWWLELALGIPLLLILAWYAQKVWYHMHNSLLGDFLPVYVAAHNGVRGPEVYSVDYLNTLVSISIPPQLGVHSVGGGYVYPPILLDIVSPLASLPFEQFRVVWVIISASAWLAVGPLLWLATSGTHSWRAWMLSLLLPLALLPSQISIGMGQVDIFGVFFVALACFLHRVRSHRLSGLMIVAAGLAKVYPLAVVAALAIRRQVSSVVSLVAGIFVLALASLVLFDKDTTLAYINSLVQSGSAVVGAPESVSLSSIITTVTPDAGIGNVLNLGMRGVLLAVFVSLLWRRRVHRWVLPDIAMIFIASIVIHGMSWHSRLVWLVFPVFCLLVTTQGTLTRSALEKTLAIGIMLASSAVVLLDRWPGGMASSLLLNILLVAAVVVLVNKKDPVGLTTAS